jgi:hypothetical protein
VWLATLGWDATGVDFSDVGLAKAAKLAEANEVTARTRWVCADATSWVPDEQFDLVAVAYLHLSEPLRRAAMSVAVAALAPGGTLVVIGHDATNITEGVGGPPDPAVLYGPDDIVGDLHSADLALVVERAERVLRAVRVETDGVAEERHAIDCLVRVCRP